MIPFLIISYLFSWSPMEEAAGRRHCRRPFVCRKNPGRKAQSGKSKAPAQDGNLRAENPERKTQRTVAGRKPRAPSQGRNPRAKNPKPRRRAENLLSVKVCGEVSALFFSIFIQFSIKCRKNAPSGKTAKNPGFTGKIGL